MIPHDERFEREVRFDALYRATADRMMAYCLRLAGPDQAEDAFAEVYATAWRKLDQVPEHAVPWLYVTARTTILAQRRQALRQNQIADRLLPLSQLAAEPAWMDVERRSELLSVLSSLGEEDREAMLLTHWDGLSTQEAAKVLGITPGALRVRMHRARSTLRRNARMAGAHHA